MPQNFPQLDSCLPTRPDFAQIFAARAFTPFADEVLTLLAELSARLLHDPQAKSHSDVIAFAFWCRKGALQAMKETHAGKDLRLGRGVVLHVTPANVPVNFAYSLVAGLLAGNINIVRLPSKKFPQVEIICEALRKLLERAEFATLRDHVTLLRYEKNDVVTDFLSAHCDVRIIWGGDLTIAEIRRSPLPPRSFDLTFADRYSLCVIAAGAYLDAADHIRIAQDFFNDTYLFDQNACTAPHLVIWLGSSAQVTEAKKVFWDNLYKVVVEKYVLQPVVAVDKLSDAYHFVAQMGGCRVQWMGDNLIVRVQLPRLERGIEECRSTCGFFYEYDAVALSEILPIVNRRYQTLACYGVDRYELERVIASQRPVGIDRIVPIGRTLDFSLVWDGYDLIGMLSRIVTINTLGPEP